MELNTLHPPRRGKTHGNAQTIPFLETTHRDSDRADLIPPSAPVKVFPGESASFQRRRDESASRLRVRTPPQHVPSRQLWITGNTLHSHSHSGHSAFIQSDLQYICQQKEKQKYLSVGAVGMFTEPSVKRQQSLG